MQGIMCKYIKYDNYDAINVDRVKDIPTDYEGVMRCSNYISWRS